jgi:hypothetical protein
MQKPLYTSHPAKRLAVSFKITCKPIVTASLARSGKAFVVIYVSFPACEIMANIDQLMNKPVDQDCGRRRSKQA